MTSSRACMNDTNALYYTCGQFTIKRNRMKINEFLQDTRKPILHTSKSSLPPEPLVSPLKEKNWLESGTLVTYHRNRDADFLPFFKQTTDLVYFSDLEQVLLPLVVGQYNASDWRLFIDSSKRSLKFVLLHNTNNMDPFQLNIP